MHRGNAFTEVPLEQAFSDFESVRICAFKPKGWERQALARRVDSGELVRPMPGMYARAAYWNGLSRPERLLHVVKTESICHPGWTFTHATAALVHGLDVSHDLLWPIHYATSRSGGGKASAHFVHHRFTDAETTCVDDIRVTCLAQTVVDCARTYPFGLALAIADSALHGGLITRDDLTACISAQPGRRGNKLARRVMALASPLPESGGESLVRALMMDLGLPEPQLQAPIERLGGRGDPYRVDFLFSGQDAGGTSPVAFELDGIGKYADEGLTGGRSMARVFTDERQREAEITAKGIRVMRLRFDQAIRPEILLNRLAEYGIHPKG